MKSLFLVIASLTTIAAETLCFPDDFLFGSATAAYQVEGGWNETGRSPSIWDDYCRANANVECANIADDFLHRYESDVDLMVETGLDMFRFSVSWSRVMKWDSETKRMKPNLPGIVFYQNLIATLLRKNIRPVLTLYHWDLPSDLHTQLDPPGWLNPEIVGHFVDFAEVVFRAFGSQVNLWTTFNEPSSFVVKGYGKTRYAPGLPPSATSPYTATHHVLLSHAKAVQRFRQLKLDGIVKLSAQIGIVLVSEYYYPLNPSSSRDVEAAARKIEFMFGWYLRPIVSGEYPEVMRERAGERLPSFTAEESALLKGSYDLFMLNHYSSKVVVDCDAPESSVDCSALALGWERDHGCDDTRHPPGARGSSKGADGSALCPWFSAYPQGYLDTIRWMHALDPSAKILLTENGWCGDESLNNADQNWYLESYISQVHRALIEEHIPIIGYTAWSLLDNYEWGSFKPRFGLFFVNYTAQTGSKDGYVPQPTDLARVPRQAAKWFGELAKTKCFKQLHSQPIDLAVTDIAWGSSAQVIGLLIAVTVAGVAVARSQSQGTREETAPLLR